MFDILYEDGCDSLDEDDFEIYLLCLDQVCALKTMTKFTVFFVLLFVLVQLKIKHTKA